MPTLANDQSPNSQCIVSGSDDRTVRLWNAGTGAALQMLEGYSSDVKLMALSQDSRAGLLVLNDWVIEGKVKILWLPPDY